MKVVFEGNPIEIADMLVNTVTGLVDAVLDNDVDDDFDYWGCDVDDEDDCEDCCEHCNCDDCESDAEEDSESVDSPVTKDDVVRAIGNIIKNIRTETGDEK